jgi:hypothetical protein
MQRKQRSNTVQYQCNVLGYNVTTVRSVIATTRYYWVLRKGLHTVATGTTYYRTRARTMQHGIAAAQAAAQRVMPRYCTTHARMHIGGRYSVTNYSVHVYGGSIKTARALRMYAQAWRANVAALVYTAPRALWQQCYGTVRKYQPR